MHHIWDSERILRLLVVILVMSALSLSVGYYFMNRMESKQDISNITVTNAASGTQQQPPPSAAASGPAAVAESPYVKYFRFQRSNPKANPPRFGLPSLLLLLLS